jgi:hypothetical protein
VGTKVSGPGHGEKLSRRRDLAVAALLCEPTVSAAADKAGVSERTLRSWLRRPDFRDAYQAARRQVLEGAVGRLQQAAGEAVEALRRNLTTGRPADQVRAAGLILQHALGTAEVLDVAERLEALERLLQGGQP